MAMISDGARGRLAAMVCAVLTLSACGTAADDPFLGIARGLAQGALTRNEAPAPTINPRQVLTRDIINQAGLPLILVETVATGSGATMVRLATNGSNETWQGDGGSTVTLSREGILRATQGTGADLAASDISGTRAALVGRGAGHVARLHVEVAGDLEQRQTSFSCEIARTGSERVSIFGAARVLTRVTETCHRDPTGERVFENQYWIDSGGFAWVSEQWVSADLGYLRIERLMR